jgi:hypothetical protein
VAFRAGGVHVKTSDAAWAELRALALVALALSLLAVGGLASSVSAWHATRAGSAQTTALQGLAAAGGVGLVVAVLLLWVETPTSRALKKKRRTLTGDEFDELGASLWTAGKTFAVIVLGVAIFCLAALPLLSSDSAPSAPSQSLSVARPSAPVGLPQAEGRGSTHYVHLGWLLLPIVVAFTILAPAAALVRRRRLKRHEATQAEEPGALGRAVRASIAALESERDPRAAILRAYVRMEQAFSDVEIVRARDETASEFLGRTTRRLPVSAGAAAALTERFEEVRYSTHQVTEADRAHALASLQRVERELTQRP